MPWLDLMSPDSPPTEEKPWSTHRTEKYLLRQYLADDPDPELWRILHLI
jgi:hypothetical protein